MGTVAERPINENTNQLPLWLPQLASYGKATSIHTNVTFLLCSTVLKSTAGSPRADNQLYLVNKIFVNNLQVRFISFTKNSWLSALGEPAVDFNTALQSKKVTLVILEVALL